MNVKFFQYYQVNNIEVTTFGIVKRCEAKQYISEGQQRKGEIWNKLENVIANRSPEIDSVITRPEQVVNVLQMEITKGAVQGNVFF